MEEATGSMVDHLDSSKIHFVDVDGIRTRYYADGSGEPLVLLHGGDFGQTSALDTWSLNFDGLAQHFHVFGLDRLGHGHTDNPPREADYTYEVMFSHLLGFLDAVGIEQAHFAGQSRGALPVLTLALKFPERVKTAILVDSSTAAPENPRFPSNTYFYADLAQRLPPGPATAERVRMYASAFAYNPAHITDEFVNRLLEIALLPKSQAAAQTMERIEATIWLPSLDREREECLRLIDTEGIPARTLVIWGVQDPSAPLVLGYELFERICAKTMYAELAVLNHAGHSSYRDQPAAFNRIVRSFCLG